MTQLPKVKHTLLNTQTAKKMLKSRVGQQTYQALINAADLFFSGDQLAQSGKTPFDVIYQNEIISLRHYTIQENAKHKAFRIPLVIVPPLAANTLIFDLFPHRSLVRFLIDQGFNVYMIDWGIPSIAQAKYNFGTYIKIFMPEFINKVREHSGQEQLSLYGWSLGGAISLCYTSLFKDKNIQNLIVVASPINTHKSGYLGKLYQRLGTPAQWIRKNTNFRIRQIPSRFFHIHGWQNTLGFKLTDPIGNFKNYWTLLKNLDDRQFIINHATSSSFVDNMLAYPGGVMRDIILRFWIDNELSTGVVNFGNQTAYFKDIDCSILVLGGDTDIIVTAEAVKPLINLTSSADKSFETVPGGHMGVVSGSQAPQYVWPIISRWLKQRSN